MKRHLVAVIVAMTWVQLSAQSANAETWFCAINETPGTAKIRQFQIDGNSLNDMTEEKTFLKMPDGPIARYNIMLNDDSAIIANSYNTNRSLLIIANVYVVNIILDKSKLRIVETSILSKIQDQDQGVSWSYTGSCTVKK